MQNIITRFFKRDKKEGIVKGEIHRQEIDRSFNKVLEEVHRIDNMEDPRRIQKFILDSCEQILVTARVLHREQREEKLLYDYLSDIRKLQTMPKDEYMKIYGVAESLIRVSRARESYSDNDLKLEPDKFIQLSRHEKTVPDTILRLQANEKQQSAIKRQMQQLDAKKNGYEIERDEIAHSVSMLRRMTALIFAALASVIVLLFMIDQFLGFNTMWLIFGLMLCAVCYVLFLFYQRNSMRRRNRELVRALNRVISNLNVIRMKYASISSTVDYDTGKFGVNSSYELNYLWELYLSDVSRKRQKQQDNSDYEFYSKRLYTLLENAGIKDIEIWMEQPGALLNQADLQEVNRKLVSRRIKLNERINANTNRIRSERAEINDLMREHDYYEPEIVEILATVDRRCKLNTAYNFSDKENEIT